MHSNFRVIVHSGHVSSLAMKARHKAFARCNKKFKGEKHSLSCFSSIFCLGDGWFTLTFVLNVLVYFPAFYSSIKKTASRGKIHSVIDWSLFGVPAKRAHPKQDSTNISVLFTFRTLPTSALANKTSHNLYPRRAVASL